MRWALVTNGVVANVVEQNSQPTIEGQWVECGNAGPGWTYDGSVFIQPTPTPEVRNITQYAFRQRFTQAERVGIEIASLDDSSASMVVRQQAAALRVAMTDLAQAQYVNLDLPIVAQSLADLETVGLLVSGRATAILSAPVQPYELP